MPQYNLTQPQNSIVITWLFEPNGYLDLAVRVSDGQTAREAFAADPQLDVTQWVRDHIQQDSAISSEVAMVWWIWKHDQVNVTPPQRPEEAASWVVILQGWDASIDAGFGRVPQNERNVKTVSLYDETGVLAGAMPAGSHLAQQQQLITKVMDILG